MFLRFNAICQLFKFVIFYYIFLILNKYLFHNKFCVFNFLFFFLVRPFSPNWISYRSHKTWSNPGPKFARYPASNHTIQIGAFCQEHKVRPIHKILFASLLIKKLTTVKYFSFTREILCESQQDFPSSNFTFLNFEVFFYGKKMQSH